MATETAVRAQSALRAEAGEAIVIEGLTRRYGERDALAEVTTCLGHRQSLVVLGRNGAGKTTLLRVLATLLLPHAGRVRVLGLELPRGAHALRPRIGMLGHAGVRTVLL